MKNFFRLAVIIGSLPVTLTNGQTADATQVMSDLNWIVNQVNANAAASANTAFVNVNNSFTVIQSGQAATLPANFPIASQVQNSVFSTLSSTLGTNTLSARIAALPLSAYAVGQVFSFVPSQPNTSSVTMNIDSLGSAVLKSRGNQLTGGELGSSAALVVVTSLIGQTTMDLLNSKRDVPAGVMLDFAGVNAPPGYLLCDGSNVLRSTFAGLFSAISTTWGVGDGSTTFTLPDMRRRTTVGSGGSATATLGSGVGATGGEESHILIISELAAHTHPGSTVGGYDTGGGFTGVLSASGSLLGNVGLSIASQGSGTGHNTIQPSAIVTKIIKT